MCWISLGQLKLHPVFRPETGSDYAHKVLGSLRAHDGLSQDLPDFLYHRMVVVGRSYSQAGSYVVFEVVNCDAFRGWASLSKYQDNPSLAVQARSQSFVVLPTIGGTPHPACGDLLQLCLFLSKCAPVPIHGRQFQGLYEVSWAVLG